MKEMNRLYCLGIDRDYLAPVGLLAYKTSDYVYDILHDDDVDPNISGLDKFPEIIDPNQIRESIDRWSVERCLAYIYSIIDIGDTDPFLSDDLYRVVDTYCNINPKDLTYLRIASSNNTYYLIESIEEIEHLKELTIETYYWRYSYQDCMNLSELTHEFRKFQNRTMI